VLIEPPRHLPLESVQALLKGRVGEGHTAELDEGAHDLDVHSDGLLAAKNTGEHRHSLLGEYIGGVTTAPAPIV
jgi:hypothetical protein